jgi:hypothetical protein
MDMTHPITVPILTVGGSVVLQVLLAFLVAFVIYWLFKFVASLIVGG